MAEGWSWELYSQTETKNETKTPTNVSKLWCKTKQGSPLVSAVKLFLCSFMSFITGQNDHSDRHPSMHVKDKAILSLSKKTLYTTECRAAQSPIIHCLWDIKSNENQLGTWSAQLQRDPWWGHVGFRIPLFNKKNIIISSTPDSFCYHWPFSTWPLFNNLAGRL